jgi:NagD protein
MRSAAAYMDLEPANVTVIGDTMETQIIGGNYMGFQSILFFYGIADE